ncbi:hemicentin-1-like [Gigantopelta aegis]|uniref:hemicentin-1-like n=1 Tax=Gigantopelta aegis TaxID=1735272 RepID=UPI001B88DCAE|nr:hemicentin-1-like [Gigantopelta aegis]
MAVLLCVLVSVIAANYVLGVSLNISGSSSHAVLNEPFTFTCTVSQAAGISDAVYIYKKTKATLLAPFYQSGSSCTVLSGPPPGYTATCGSGTDSSSSSTKNYILKINRTAEHDDTDWWCLLNTARTRSHNFSLEVYSGPDSVTFSPPSPGDVTEGEDLTVNCSADCNPPCGYSWTLGTQQLSSSSLLTLTNINRTQAGVYMCTASNTFIPKSKSKHFNLTVYYPPREAPVISGTGFPVLEGDVITLHCSTTGGNPKPTLTWLCPGGSTPCSNTDSGETRTCTISFTANRRHNNVDCVCTPSWQYGAYTESKSRKMIIYYPPGTPSLYPGSSHPWLEDRTASLICSLPSGDQGNPEATFHWIRNNNDIEKHTGFNYTFTPSKEDNGDEYRCTAGNLFTDRDGQSRPVSRPVQLNVYYSPRIQIKMLTPNTHKEGDDLDLTCTADSNPSSQRVKWIYGGHEISGGNLRLTNLNRTDHGQYRCNVTVAAGSYGNLTNSSNIQVVVNYAPYVTFLSLNSTENYSSTFTCPADGRPGNMNFRRFSHYWNDVFIRDVSGTPVGHNETRLTFNRATYEDSGTYYCTVDNGVPDRSGTKQQTASSYVYIRATPKITKETELHIPVGAEIGKPAILQKTVFSKPDDISFNWNRSDSKSTFNYTNIEPENITLEIYGKTVKDSGYRITLNITSFSPNDTGTYTLNVCNDVGCSQFSVKLTAAGPPLPPKEFQQEGESSHTVKLSWLSNYPGGNYKQRFVLEYKLQSESEWTLKWTSDWFEDLHQDQKMFYNITNLEASQVYDIRLSAENERPKNNVSDFVNITAMTAKEAEKLTGSGFGIGAAVGGAVGSVAVVGVIVVLVVFFVRRSRLSSKNNNNLATTTYEGITLRTVAAENSTDDAPQTGDSDRTYEGLQERRDSAQYSKLTMYQNLHSSDDAPQTGDSDRTYEGLQERRDSAQYSKLTVYQNLHSSGK